MFAWLAVPSHSPHLGQAKKSLQAADRLQLHHAQLEMLAGGAIHHGRFAKQMPDARRPGDAHGNHLWFDCGHVSHTTERSYAPAAAPTDKRRERERMKITSCSRN